MTKTNITIICSIVFPIFAIGVIAVLLWVFKEEVMKLWEKLREKCGECIGGEKKVEDVEKSAVDTESHATNNKAEIRKLVVNYGENREKAADDESKLWKEVREGYKEMKGHLTNIENAIRNPESVPKPEIEVDPEKLKKLFQDYNNNPDEGMKEMYKYVEDRDKQSKALKEKQSIEI